ncbi:PAS domain-containing protein [Brevundimonas sp. S30B]|nr:PAS domain-containing protein [Brevundimonas sp. MF30-B]TFW03651.1 PAS domain-containing protein [Brevundimonas sp. S30B]
MSWSRNHRRADALQATTRKGGGLKELAKSSEVAQQLAAAFDASANPYMVLDRELRFAGVNQAYLDAVQRQRDDLLGKVIFDEFDGGEEGRASAQRLRDSFERVLATGERDILPVIHYAIPVTGPDGRRVLEDRFWSAVHTPMKDAEGRVAYILQHTSDITEMERLRRQLADKESDAPTLDRLLSGAVLNRAEKAENAKAKLEREHGRLMDLFRRSPQAVAVLLGEDHRFQFTNGAYDRIVGRTPAHDQPIREFMPEIEGQGFIDLLDSVYATGEAVEAHAQPAALNRTPNAAAETRYIDLYYQPIRGDGDATIGVFVQGNDVTEKVLADRRQRLMIDELNHRVKNTLATVQSIAMQTARSNSDPRSFAETFQARLLALSHTHDLLTRSHWEGADLRSILEHETAAHGAQRIVLNGPPLSLAPSRALSLGMIFHELATNAAKYGALSAPEGRVFVDWSVADQRAPRLSLSWQERGGPPVVAPERRGFGSRLIERNVRHDLGGELQTRYSNDGLEVDISLPLDGGDLQ